MQALVHVGSADMTGLGKTTGQDEGSLAFFPAWIVDASDEGIVAILQSRHKNCGDKISCE